HVGRAAADLGPEPRHRAVRDPQPGRGGLPRRRDPGDGGAAGAHHRAHRGRPAAAAHPRHAGRAGARRAAQPHLAPDRGAAAVIATRTRWLHRIAVTLAVLAVWELLYRTGLLSPVIFGAPSLIYAAALKDGGTFLGALRVTGGEMLVAVAIAWLGGVA